MKKVLTITSLSIVAALLIATIVLACIPVGSIPSFASPDAVIVYDSDLGVGKANEDAAKDDLIAEMKAGVKQQCLPAIFNGTLDNIRVNTTETKNYKTRGDNGDSKVLFEFKYDSVQEIKVDGTTINYYCLLFEVNESVERGTMTIYVMEDQSSISSSSAPYKTTIEVDGNFGNLYAAVRELIDAHK